jgi:hypothetical protein
VAAAIAFARNETDKAAKYRAEALSFAPMCVREGVPSELLYGRAGFLSCLLFMAAHAGLQLKDVGDIVAGAVQLIIQDGRALAEADAAADATAGRRPAGFPLMWQWHDKRYLGAAHGVCGILTVLLHLRSLVVALGCDGHLRGTIDALLDVRFPSGNLPSSLSLGNVVNTNDKLVHWCHGAPGLVPMLCAAADAYHEQRQRYLVAAAQAAGVISQRGLLHKGFGICHGVGGNGLAMLRLHYAQPDDGVWLAEATRFGLFACLPACAEGEEVKKLLLITPDRPHSLFEGYAGLACLLAALLEHSTAADAHTQTHTHSHTHTHTHTRASPSRYSSAGAPWLM